MNREIIELREVITKLVPLLSGQGLRVTQRGSQAYVRANAHTKKPEIVNIPNISDNASPEFILAIHGFIDHEVAHVLFTDFSTQTGHKPGSMEDNRLHGLHNIVEDTMIEKEMVKVFPGSARNLSNVRKHFLIKVSDEAIAKAADDKEKFQYILVPAMRALSGHTEMQDWMDDHDHWSNPVVDEMMKKLSPKFLADIKTATTTAQTLVLAKELEAILYPPEPPQQQTPPPPPPQQDSDDSDTDDSDDSGESQDKPDQEAGEGDGDGERDHSESEADEDEESDDQDASGGASSDDEEDSDEDTEDDSEDGESGDTGTSDEEDEDSEQGDTDEAEGTDTDEDEDDGETEDTDEDSGEDDGDADAGDESDGGSDSDDGDVEEDADSGDLGDTEGSDSDASGDTDDAEDADGDLVEVKAVTDVDGDVEHGQDTSDEDGDGGGVGAGSGKSLFDFDDDAFASVDLSSSMAALISTDAQDVMSRSDYTVFTREFDRIEPVKPPENINDLWIPEMEEKTDQMAGRMQKDIERIMASQNHVVRIPGHRSGKLHAASLYRVPMGDPRVFTQKQEHTSKNTAVSLLFDNSGSMYGEKFYLAAIATYALVRTLDRVNIPNEAIGFTTGDWGDIPKKERSTVMDEMKTGSVGFHRTVPLIMPIYKSFDERVNTVIKKRFAYMMNAQRGLNTNVDGESLQIAAERLMRRQEKRKVILVLSDGAPSGASNAGPHLRSVVEDLEKIGIECIGIGIKDRNVSKFYKNHVILSNLDDLPTQVMSEIKALLG